MPHAAQEVATVRKRIKGLSKTLGKKWFSSYSPTLDSRETWERKAPHGNKIISDKNFKIKLDIFLKEPTLL